MLEQAKVTIPYRVQSVRVINQQLWCCCDDAGIVNFDSELQQQRSIPADDIGKVFDVAEMRNGDVIIATDNGLYVYSSNGEWYQLILTKVSNQ